MTLVLRTRAGVVAGALVLAACATTGPKTPLAPGERLLSDRIDALETDIEQLHAEMQELRIAHLPVEEMSEEEFARHLEKVLAKATPETREEVEKALRARRGAARFSQEGASRYWEDRFEQDKNDDPWAKKAYDQCQPLTEKALPQGAKLLGHECKNERCRVEIEYPSEKAMPPDAENLCVTGPGGAELFAGAMITRRATTSKGRVTTVVFVVRKGYPMTPG